MKYGFLSYQQKWLWGISFNAHGQVEDGTLAHENVYRETNGKELPNVGTSSVTKELGIELKIRQTKLANIV